MIAFTRPGTISERRRTISDVERLERARHLLDCCARLLRVERLERGQREDRGRGQVDRRERTTEREEPAGPVDLGGGGEVDVDRRRAVESALHEVVVAVQNHRAASYGPAGRVAPWLGPRTRTTMAGVTRCTSIVASGCTTTPSTAATRGCRAPRHGRPAPRRRPARPTGHRRVDARRQQLLPDL